MISLCIISRKEDEKQLNQAIKSCRDYVDEIILVDTTDYKTKKHDVLKVVWDSPNQDGEWDYSKLKTRFFTWTDDFAAARNFSFEQATGDVIFWLDSDDTVTNPENLPKLAKLITDGRADWIYSKYNYSRDEFGNLVAVHWKPRLFRKGSCKWVGRVHEDTVPVEGVIQVKDEDTEVGTITIEHHTSPEHHDSSNERNLRIMLAEYEEKGEDTDPRTLQYIGIALLGTQRYEEAIPFLRMHIERSGSNSDRFWSLCRLSECLVRIGESRNAISVCMDALKLYPEWKTAYFQLASIYHELEDWPKVVEWTLIGVEKEVPNIMDVINPMDYEVLPMGRLAQAYFLLNQPNLALDAAEIMLKAAPSYPLAKEILDTTKEAVDLENYVRSFLNVASHFAKYDRIKTSQLFDLIPKELDDDIRIQQARNQLVPPTTWGEKSVVIFCGESLEDWAYPSIFKGIGGSEEAVIMVSEELAKLGYQVTVFNQCGNLKGNYNGVEYRPYYHFSLKDSFNVFISWRNPGLFMHEIKAKKKYLWLHDILYNEAINQKIIDSVDKILFLSKWHSTNVPIPGEKIFITNNGINPSDFKDLPPKRPYSLFWGSSYDRGLLPFLKNIWPLIKKELPEVTLDVAYGWQNIEKEMSQLPTLQALYRELKPLLESTPGVTHHGRLPHRKLAKLMGECMAYPYASEFGETCNITSQKCQAAGCYVITCSGAGGTPERVKWGQVIECSDIYTNKEKQKEFADAVISYLKQADLSKVNAKNIHVQVPVGEFSWETTANQWVKEVL